jgi:long-chain acyl-CoA synthetase
MSGGGAGTLWSAFRARTDELRNRPAVAGVRGELTFSELWEGADALAGRLRTAGVPEGALVGLALPNSPHFVKAFLALCRIDACVVLIPAQFRSAEFDAVARGVGLRFVVSDSDLAPGLADVLPGARASSVDGLQVVAASGVEESTHRHAALMKLSSGSTAQPKCIALTAENLLAEGENLEATLELGPGDRVLAAVPLAHSYGFDLGMVTTLYAGSTLEIDDVFVPRRTLAALAERRPTAYVGVPAAYRAMIGAHMPDPPDLSCVRWLLSATAPLPVEVVTTFADRFGAPICQHYGASEAGPVTMHVPACVLERPDSVGRAMEGVRVSVVSPDGDELPAGQEGEVVVSSDSVARGYILGAPPGLSPFRAEGFWTGDLGRLDEEGFLTVLGRRDALINIGGFKVSPVEVAAALERHPAVREAAVLGIETGAGEQAVCAAVELQTPVAEAELIAFCGRALAEYKVPRRVVVFDALPRTASGKVRLRPEDFSA